MNRTSQNFLKIMTIFGTRPEIIRLSRVFAKFDKYSNHVMVYTNQSYDYEMSKIFFKDLEIRKPDYLLNVKSETLGGQVAKIILESEKIIIKEKPDALLVLGDTNSALASICAKRMKIPVFHMEAGNRCFDERVPEEINRKIVDHISDINLPYSENARLYLINEGIHPGTIFVTGSPMAEVLEYYKDKIEQSNVLKKMNLLRGKYFVASIHREENVENKETLGKIIDALDLVSAKYKLPILLSTHPRTAKKIADNKFKNSKSIIFHKPFGYFDYVSLQKNSFCVLSDSGTILEESSILQFPAIQVRESSERPEAYDEGTAILSGIGKDNILRAVNIVTKQFASGERFNVPRNYQDTNVSSKVLRLVIGLTEITQKKRTF